MQGSSEMAGSEKLSGLEAHQQVSPMEDENLMAVEREHGMQTPKQPALEQLVQRSDIDRLNDQQPGQFAEVPSKVMHCDDVVNQNFEQKRQGASKTPPTDYLDKTIQPGTLMQQQAFYMQSYSGPQDGQIPPPPG